MTKRIAILTLSVGSGHLQAAKAIEHALEDGADRVEVRTIDALPLARRWFHWVYVHSYWWMLRNAPGVWRRLYERRQEKRHHSTAPDWVFRRGCREVLRQIKAFSPHLIIVTEIGAAEIASLGKREGWFNVPILAVQTDVHTEPPWAQKEIDIYCVASEMARAQLIEWGISANRIVVCGVPIDPAFALPFDRPELLRALGLDPRRPVVLVMGGGMGPVPLDEIVQSLERCRLPLQVLAVAGHDHVVRARLDALHGKVAMNLVTFGWSDSVPELMAVANLLITKPGGMTTAEAMAAGLPMILTHAIPGHEEMHSSFYEQNGVAFHARTLDEIPQLTFKLLNDTNYLAELSRRAREIGRPDATHAIAQVGRAMLEKSTYIDLLASPPSRPGESAYLM